MSKNRIFKYLKIVFIIMLCCSCTTKDVSNNGEIEEQEEIIEEVVNNNLIIFIGDGMGPDHIEAASLYLGDSFLLNKLNHINVNTNSLDANNEATIVTDSAAAGTTLASGALTIRGRIGKDKDENDLRNIMEYAKSLGKSTGIISTDVCYGGTPAAFSAHVSSRESFQEIVESEIESSVDLFISASHRLPLKNKDAINEKYTFVESFSEAKQHINDDKLFVLAQFEDRDGEDKLADVIDFGIDFLSKNENGYVLMIEEAYIDDYSHDFNFRGVIKSLTAMSEGINCIVSRIDKNTKMIITADHETGGLTVSDTEKLGKVFEGINYNFLSRNHTDTEVYLYTYNFEIDAKDYSSLQDKTKLKNKDIFKIYEDILTNTIK